MTAVEMRNYFDQLCDKVGQPWFTDTEKDRFLTNSQWDIINEAIENLEEDEMNLNRIRTIVATDSLSISGGTIALSGFTTDPVHILTIEITPGGGFIKFARWNDIEKFTDNTYKAPSATNPYYTIKETNLAIHGLSTGNVNITYVGTPTAIDALPEKVHNEQVSRAMAKTGWVTESEALVVMGKDAEL